MIMNWHSLIKLLLPIRLRTAKLLIALLSALTAVTRNRFDSDYAWVQNLIKELKYTSQVQAMVKLLNDKFDPINRSIIIEDGTDGNVSLWGDVSPWIVIAGTTSNIVIAYPHSLTSVGLDFVVKVPFYLNKDIVRGFVKRYVSCGVGFEVINL